MLRVECRQDDDVDSSLERLAIGDTIGQLSSVLSVLACLQHRLRKHLEVQRIIVDGELWALDSVHLGSNRELELVWVLDHGAAIGRHL